MAEEGFFIHFGLCLSAFGCIGVAAGTVYFARSTAGVLERIDPGIRNRESVLIRVKRLFVHHLAAANLILQRR